MANLTFGGNTLTFGSNILVFGAAAVSTDDMPRATPGQASINARASGSADINRLKRNPEVNR